MGHPPTLPKTVLEAYATFEEDEREVISGLFGDVCALCTSTCCTPDICEESCDSAFLRALRMELAPGTTFCERFGWLTEKGCALQAGRPPVCYGFFCNEIVEALSARDREVLRVLGRLVSWVGERAIGSQHLVEPMDDAALADIKTDRVLSRIEIARSALRGVCDELANQPADDASLAAMQQIQRSFTRDV